MGQRLRAKPAAAGLDRRETRHRAARCEAASPRSPPARAADAARTRATASSPSGTPFQAYSWWSMSTRSRPSSASRGICGKARIHRRHDDVGCAPELVRHHLPTARWRCRSSGAAAGRSRPLAPARRGRGSRSAGPDSASGPRARAFRNRGGGLPGGGDEAVGAGQRGGIPPAHPAQARAEVGHPGEPPIGPLLHQAFTAPARGEITDTSCPRPASRSA